MHTNIVFFGKFILGIIFQANSKNDGIKSGKKKAKNKLKFEVIEDSLMFRAIIAL